MSPTICTKVAVKINDSAVILHLHNRTVHKKNIWKRESSSAGNIFPRFLPVYNYADHKFSFPRARAATKTAFANSGTRTILTKRPLLIDSFVTYSAVIAALAQASGHCEIAFWFRPRFKSNCSRNDPTFDDILENVLLNPNLIG